MKKLPILGLLALCPLAFGCDAAGDAAGVDEPHHQAAAGKADQWNDANDPSLFSDDLEYELAKLPEDGAAARTPWAGTYWATYEDNINYKWAGASSDSPAAKYGQAFDVPGLEDIISRLYGIDSRTSAKTCKADGDCDSSKGEACATRAGKDEGRCIPTWFGICHAWAPVAIMEPEPVDPVTRNGVTFKVNDLKALITLIYNHTASRFLSQRCNQDASGIEVDEFGNPTESGCKDTNAGAFHVITTNYLGLKGQAFVEDKTYDDEVWNQPVAAYRINSQAEVTAKEANEALGVKAPDGGEVPETYAFNSRAVKFYLVAMELDYISESSAHTDGNLSSKIAQYTNTDDYRYVLEVDEDGKVNGGEWVGASKKNHPDFLWLPTGRRSNAIAEGKLSYAVIKDMLDESVNGASGFESKVFGEDASVARGDWKHYGPFASAAGVFEAVTSGAGGDVDLFVRKGARPTKSTYDCRPYVDGSNEICTLNGPGEFYVSVHGYAKSDYHLAVTYKEATGEAPVTPPSDVAHLDESGHVDEDELVVFSLLVPGGRAIELKTQAAGDVDLYVRMGAAPTTTTFDARAYTDSGNETVNFTPPTDGTLFVAVHGYEASDFELTTSGF